MATEPTEADVRALLAEWEQNCDPTKPSEADLPIALAKALASHRWQRIPPGWVAVPREPTEAMLTAGWDESVVGTRDGEDVRPVWNAMIEEAPEP